MALTPLKGSSLNGSIYEHGSIRASRYSARHTNQQIQAPRCTIELEKVIGNTITSSNGFDSVPEGTFAVCSGSAAVVSKILENGAIEQSVFRAPTRTIAEQSQTIDSVNNTPSRTRGKQTPRASILGGLLSPDFKDSPGNTAVHKKSKGTSCLALSSNGQFLAVGETGYAPRVLLFCTSNTDGPASIVSEHVSGVQTLSFSLDAKWLCSVGDIYDGYIHLWSVSTRGVLKLCASSKCTSTVHATRWISDSAIITAGLRHLKIWRPEIAGQSSISPSKFTFPSRIRSRQDSPVASPGLKSLPGRNVLLNDLLESTFSAICALSNSRALVGSDQGDLSIVSVEKGTQKLDTIAHLGAPIKCMTSDLVGGIVYIVTTEARLWSCSISKLKAGTILTPLSDIQDFYLDHFPVAIGIAGAHLLCIDESRRITRRKLQSSSSPDVIGEALSSIHAHSTAVNGAILSVWHSEVEPEPNEASALQLLSYDTAGRLINWQTEPGNTNSSPSTTNLDFASRPSFSDEEPNELKVLRQDRGSGMAVSGDKYGCISLFDSTWQMVDQALAHTGEVNDIAIFESSSNSTMLISCGRDRSLQVFQARNRLDLAQTIEQHNASVNKLEVIETDNVTLLLSLSSDRTVLVHKLAQIDDAQAFMCVRIITLKSTPLSCALDVLDASVLAVTTTDKQLQYFNLKTGLLDSSVRITEDEDQVIMQEMILRATNTDDKSSRILVGYSNADKVIRVHNAQSGEMLCKANGHSESITSLVVLEEKTEDSNLVIRLATTSLDGTVMFWSVSCRILERSDSKDSIEARQIRQTPLRKVLSRSQLRGFAASMEGSEWSPLPSPSRENSPWRNASPDRLRRRTSVPNLVSNSPTPILTPTPRPYRDADTSPTLASPLNTRRRSVMSRSNSSTADAVDPVSATQQFIASLRIFRTNLRSINDMNPNTRNELKMELETTLDAVIKHGTDNKDSSQDNSYFPVMEGLQNLTIAEEH